VARAAAEAYLGELDERAVKDAAVGTLVPGRFEQLDGEPPTFLDGAHNPGGMAALAETVREELAGRQLTLVLSILDDKDAGEMLRQIVPVAGRVIATSNANPRALSPATLESLSRQVGAADVSVVSDPRRALTLARQVARTEDGAVLVTGSIYLIADLLRTDPGKAGSTL
jgi:dihydrofolate synthase/folylpolyglutamate synthase